MKAQIIRSIGLVVSAAVLGGCLVWFFTPNPKPEDAGEWKPTGDGKTIVNSKTGELRLTRNGMEVGMAEDIANRMAILREHKAESLRKQQEQAAEAQRQAEARSNEILRLDNERRIAGIRFANEANYDSICTFIDGQSKQGFPDQEAWYAARWNAATKRFRDRLAVYPDDIDALLNLLAYMKAWDAVRNAGIAKAASERGMAVEDYASYFKQDVSRVFETAEWERFIDNVDSIRFEGSISFVGGSRVNPPIDVHATTGP